MSRAAWFRNWLQDAELLVQNVERLAAAGGQASGDDARSVRYFAQTLHDLAAGERPGLNAEAIMRTAAQLHSRLAIALQRMGSLSTAVTPAG
jgi:hypothetical protein